MCRLCLSVRTHSAGSGIRDATLVLDPAIVRTFFMGERSVESSSDGRHREHTHCRTTKYRAAGEKRGGRGVDKQTRAGKVFLFISFLLYQSDMLWFICTYCKLLWTKSVC